MRCKFKLDSITRTAGMQLVPGTTNKYETVEKRSLKFSPVYSSDPTHENRQFWDATPSGSFQVDIVNLNAVKDMDLNEEYYLDITPAKKAAAV